MEVNHCEVGSAHHQELELGPVMEDIVFFHHFLDQYPGSNRDVSPHRGRRRTSSQNTARSDSRAIATRRNSRRSLFGELGITMDDIEAVEEKTNSEIEKAKIS